MLSSNNMNPIKKNLILSAIGIGLQTIGGTCLVIAAVRLGKEINHQIKTTVIKELSNHGITE